MKLKTSLGLRIQSIIDAPGRAWHEKENDLGLAFSAILHDKAQVSALLMERLLEVKEGKDDKSEFVGDDIILARGKNFAISLRRVDESPKSDLATNSDVFFIASLDAPIKYRFFTPASKMDLNIYDPEILLVEHDTQTANAMSVVKFADPQTLFEIEIAQPTKMMRLVVNRPRAERSYLLWSFSRETLRPLGVSANDFKDTAMVHACEALAEFDNDSSINPLKCLATSASSHFVRWAAIKSLASIDANVALPIVVEAKSDSHPHIRVAAQAAEQQLSEF